MSSSVETFAQTQVDGLKGTELTLPGKPRTYISGWTADSNATDHNLVFYHKLGTIPFTVKLYFSCAGGYFPLVWSWAPGGTGNPVTVSATTEAIILGITSGAPLHGFWQPEVGWTSYSTGSWLVYASTEF